MKTAIKPRQPWAFLDAYRGKTFQGEWPTLPELFEITVGRYGDTPCFTDFTPDKVTRTHSEARENIRKLAAWMLEAGVKTGDHVAVSGKNSSEWATVYLAALYAGAIIVPIDYGLHDAEIANLLHTAKPVLFFIDEEKHDYFVEHDGGAKIYSLSPKYGDLYAYNLAPKKSAPELPVKTVKDTDTAAIMFTSGTSGTPKGVVLSHANLVSDAVIAQSNLDVYSTDVFYALLPLHHSYTMCAVLIVSICQGCEIVFAKTMAVTRMLKELREGKITMLLGVPLLFNKLLAGILKGIRDKGIVVYGIMRFLMGVSYFIKKLTGKNPGHALFKTVLDKASIATLRVAICGGGPLAASVFKIYNELGIDFIQGYGLTETSPIIALNPIEHFKIESVGADFYHAWPAMELKILDPDESGVGEVAVKGPMVMKGYYNMPEETKAVFTDDGWLRTGDLGRLDDEHYLYLSGRAKNMIVTEGGKNVYPEELENAFQLFTDIEQLTVKGYLQDAATKSEGIEALVYPSDDAVNRLGLKRDAPDFNEKVMPPIKAIIDNVNKTFPPYAKISRITILKEALEMTTTKKVKR
jgi:long-chain acyl-CoA synthetase